MSSLDTSPLSLPIAENPASELSAGKSSASLGEKMHAGVGWTAFGSLLNQVLVLARTLILARLLSTGDFGLMGMAYTITGALGVLTNLNLGTSAIVARFDDEEQLHRHLNTVWAAGIGRGLLLTLILIAAAFPTARFYGDARLAPILMVLAATPLIASFNNIGLTLATRRVDLGLTTKFSLASSVVSLLIVVVLAFWTRNVWALVWGNVLGTVLSIALSFAFHPYRPRWQFDRREFDAAFSFGKWMFVVGVMVYITTTADNVLVGRLLGASVLGAYVVAYSIANLPQNLVSQIFGTVLLPSFAQLGRDDLRKLEDTLSRVFALGAALLMLVTVPMALLAPEVVHVAFHGDKWQAAIAPLRVLVFVGLFRGLIQIITPLIVGMNRPRNRGALEDRRSRGFRRFVVSADHAFRRGRRGVGRSRDLCLRLCLAQSDGAPSRPARLREISCYSVVVRAEWRRRSRCGHFDTWRVDCEQRAAAFDRGQRYLGVDCGRADFDFAAGIKKRICRAVERFETAFCPLMRW